MTTTKDETLYTEPQKQEQAQRNTGTGRALPLHTAPPNLNFQ